MILQNALQLRGLISFFIFHVDGRHMKLNSNGEIIGMKMEKLNFDEAISCGFLIALTPVKKR